MSKRVFTGTLVSMSLMGATALPACTSQVAGGGSAGGPTGSSSGSGASPNLCDTYKDQVPAGDAVITLKNSTSAPIYISSYACNVDLGIAVPGQQQMSGELRGETYEITCQQLMAGKMEPGTYDCIGSSYAPIASGESIQIRWSGLIYEFVLSLPEECVPSTSTNFEPEHSCVQPKAPPTGKLEAHIRVLTNCEKFDGSNCVGNYDDVDAAQTFNYPNDKQVLIEVK